MQQPKTSSLRLLLACARVHPIEQDEAAIRRLLDENVDWTKFAQKAIDHGIAGLVGHTLARLVPDRVPSDILGAFQTLIQQTREFNHAILSEFLQLVDGLAAAGVELISYKGPALTMQAYGDLGLRRFRDLDFLVRDSDLPRTLKCLQGFGYERPNHLTAEQSDLVHRLQGQDFVVKQDKVPIEPHTRLIPIKMALDIDYDGLWCRAQRRNIGGHNLLTFAPEDTLLVLAIHGGKELWWDIKWACDVAGFIASQPALDWNEIATRARAYGCHRMLLVATSLARNFLGAGVPDFIAAMENSDPVVERIIGRIVTRWEMDDPGGPPSNKTVSMDRLRLHDGAVRQISYTLRTSFLPNPEHIALIALPKFLGFFYIIIGLAHDLIALPLWRICRPAGKPNNSIPANHTTLRNLTTLFATPDLFPLEVNEKRNSIDFVQVSRAWYRSNGFHHGRRLVGDGHKVFSAEVERLALHLPAADAGPPSHYILHGAYCGSTLLARSFEQLPQCFVLKEPHLLGQLARLKISPSDSLRREPQLWDDWFKVATALLTRAYSSDTAIIIKPTDLCNWMGDLLLDRDRRSKIIFLKSPLKDYITSVLRSDRDRRNKIRNRVHTLRGRLAQVPFLAEAAATSLSDGQCAAAIWLFNNYLCCSLLARSDSDRILPLNSDDLFSKPRETLHTAADFLCVTQDDANRQAVMNFSPSAHHSKDRLLPYNAAVRTSELANAELQILEEVKIAISWAKQVSSGWLSRSPFPID